MATGPAPSPEPAGRGIAKRKKKPGQRRGRTILLTMGLAFVLAQAAAGFLFDHVWPQVRFGFLYRQLAKVEQFPKPPRIVCLGSSRFGTCLLQEDMAKALREGTGDAEAAVFNASVPAGDLLAAENVLQRLLERGIRPELVLIEICPEALNRHNGWMRFHVERQLRWEDVPAYLPDISRSGELGRLCLHRLLPLLAHRKGLWTFFGQTLRGPPRMDSGKEWQQTIGLSRLDPAEKAEKTRLGLEHVRHCLRDYEPGGLGARALDNILDACLREGITPLLIVVPVSSCHRELYSPRIEREFQLYLEETCLRFDCGWLECRERIPDEDFFDNHHATPGGGKTFTQWLMREVIGTGRHANPRQLARKK